MTAARRRWLATVLALVAAATVAVLPPGAGYAAPKPSPTPAAPKEKAAPLLGDVLESTGRQYAKAKAVLDKSRQRQLKLGLQLQAAELKVKELQPQVSEFATETYRTGRLTPMVAMLNASDQGGFLEKATVLERLNQYNSSKLNGTRRGRGAGRRAPRPRSTPRWPTEGGGQLDGQAEGHRRARARQGRRPGRSVRPGPHQRGGDLAQGPPGAALGRRWLAGRVLQRARTTPPAAASRRARCTRTKR